MGLRAGRRGQARPLHGARVVRQRFRRGSLTGFSILFRCTAGQTLDVQEMTHDDNVKSGSGFTNYNVNATAAADIKVTSDFNAFGGGERSFLFNGTTYTFDQLCALSGQDWRSSK